MSVNKHDTENNPFMIDDDDNYDVILKIEGQELYINSGILCNYSSVFKEMVIDDFESPEGSIKKKEIELKGKKMKDVVVFLKLLYPDQHQEMTVQLNFKALFTLCQEFQIDWLKKQVEDYLMLKNIFKTNVMEFAVGFALAEEFELKEWKSDLEDGLQIFVEKQRNYQQLTEIDKSSLLLMTYYGLLELRKYLEKYIKLKKCYYSSTGKIIGLVLAERYDFKDLETFMLSLLKYPISYDVMKNVPGFNTLSTNVVYTLVKQRLNHISNQDPEFMVEIINILDKIYFNESLPPQEVLPLAPQTQSENPFTVNQNSDVIIIVEDSTLYLHSNVLCYCSPVFKKMLQGNFKEARTKEIVLKNKTAAHVIELFEFFYADKDKELHDDTNFDELLSLCQEYQVTWLTTKVEEYMSQSKRYLEIHQITGLLLAETYKLDRLRSKLLGKLRPILSLKNNDDFYRLKANTRYEAAKLEIISRIKINEPTYQSLINFLDSIFKLKLSALSENCRKY